MAARKKTVRKKRPIVDPCPTHPVLSMGRYRTFVRSAMRRAWLKWPPRFEALKLVRRPYVGPNKRQQWEFQCAGCKCWHMGKNVAVDHIENWGQIWNLSMAEAWSRLLVAVDKLQVLCKTCHTIKSTEEKDHAVNQ